jgi:phosphoadenosine phosphosulfate reductase
MANTRRVSVPGGEDVARLTERFEGASPQDVLRWAMIEVGRIAVASSFQTEGTCVLHMATRIRPEVPVLFLDTGFHFQETMAFKRRLTDLLGLNVVGLRGEFTPETQAAAYGDRLYERDPDLCCRLNKVLPFTEALHGFDGWITALRRDSAPTRAGTPILERYDLEPGRPILKVNPVAGWTRSDVWRYLREHRPPHNPLTTWDSPRWAARPARGRSAPGSTSETAGGTVR